MGKGHRFRFTCISKMQTRQLLDILAEIHLSGLFWILPEKKLQGATGMLTPLGIRNPSQHFIERP
jgi:hypothetical protein